jgi:hypothetical protein
MAQQRQGPAGGFAKRHVSGMLKHLADEEQRAKALEVSAAFKKLFAEKQWEPVLERIRQVAEEDHLRMVGRRRPPQLATSRSAPPVVAEVGTPPAGIAPLRSASSMMPLGRSRAPSTPRERWDVTSRGPATPLSPTPTGNAFAEGGFWEQLTPKTPAPQTPVTAVARSPFSPVVPQDHEARAAYTRVKREVEAMARTVCASRLSTQSTITSSDYIPNSLLKPRDILKGAELTLQYRQVKLQTAIESRLPQILRNLAVEEAQIIRQHSVKDLFELLDLDMWLQVDLQTLAFTTLLDAQRELIHMHRNRRKSKLLKLPDEAIRQAWATRILEDAEHVVEATGDGDSTNSNEDKGYDYNNFLRSIKSEVSSSSDLASMSTSRSCTDLSLRSSGTNMDDMPALSRQMTLASQRSSTSPRKLHDLPLRSPGKSQSNSPSPRKPYNLPLRSPAKPHSNSPSPKKHNSSTPRSRGLSLTTTFIKEESEEDEIPSSPPLSPEEKAFRHLGASTTDLNQWAEQLKDMEARHIANKNKFMSSLGRERHPAFRSAPRQRQGSVSSDDSWKCEDAARDERKNSTPTIYGTHASSSEIRSPTFLGHKRSAGYAESIPLIPSSPTRSQSTSHTFSGNKRPTGYADTIPLPSSPSSLSSPSSPTPSQRTSHTRSRHHALPPPPQGYRYATGSDASLHDSVRRSQHVRSKSSQARAGGKEEDEWKKELKRMESRERIRQEEVEEELMKRSFGERRGVGG